MNQCHRVEEKLSGYLDGELTQQDSQLVRIHIETCERCKQLHSELFNLQQQIKIIPNNGGEEAALAKITEDLAAQQKQQWGWRFFIIGAVMMMAYSGIVFLFNNGLNSFEKWAVGFLAIGVLLLFLSILRQRRIASKTDKYKDINL